MPYPENLFDSQLPADLEEQILNQEVVSYGDESKITADQFIDNLTVREYTSLIGQLEREISRIEEAKEAVINFKNKAVSRTRVSR